MMKYFILIVMIICSFPSYGSELKPYKENYIGYSEYNGKEEIKFQISFFLDIYEISKIKLSAAYTQKSYWSVFDEKDSRPFRESNYNPQIYINYKNKNCLFKLGYWHESNGRKNNYDKYGVIHKDSRSWDRAYSEITCSKDRIFTRVSFWKVFMTEHDDIIEEAGFGESYFRYNLKGFFLSASLSKAYKKLSIKLPSLITENLQLSYSIRQGSIDSLIDWDKDIMRHTIKISFGGE